MGEEVRQFIAEEEVSTEKKASGFEPRAIEIPKNIEEELDKKSIFLNLIEKVYEGKADFNPSEDCFGNPTEILIAEISGDKEKWEQRLLTKNFQDTATIFVEALIFFIEEKSKTEDKTQKAKLNNFLDKTQNQMFHWSPNIINSTGIANMFRLGPLATRVPEVQGWFGNNMVGELVYEFSFCSDGVINNILEKWQNRPISEVLDMVNFLQSVGASAIANGGWAERGLEKVKQLIKKLEKMYPCAFVDYAISNAKDRLDDEWNDPTVSVIQYRGDRANSRLTEKLDEESKNEAYVLQARINSNVAIPPSGKILRVAKDVVSIFDHSNTARSYGYYQKQGEENKMNGSTCVSNLTETFSKHTIEQIEGRDNFFVLLELISQQILEERFGVNIEDPGELAKVWGDISDFYSHEEWKKIFSYLIDDEDQTEKNPETKKLLQKIDQEGGGFFKDIKKQIQIWQKEVDKNKKDISFVDYNEIERDETLNPFGEQNEDLPLLLQHLYNPKMRTKIEGDLGLSLRDLPLRSQIRLLEFLAEPKSDRFERLQKVLQKHPDSANNVLLSFLSCAEDKKYGEAILTLLETLPPEISKQVFAKYSEIIESTEDIAGYIREQFGKDADEVEILKTRQTVLHRGNELLKKSSERMTTSDNLINQLEAIKSDTVLFASSFKTLFKNKEKIDFSEVRGLDFQRQPISWLDDATKDEMLSISKKNWAPQGKAGEGVVSEFSDTLQYGKDIDFYVLKKDNKVVAFIRFDKPTEDGHRYAGSFNVDPDYRGSAIGEAVIKNALDKEADKYILDATVYPQIQVGTKYVEESGFSITNVLPNYDNSGETFFEITCNKKNNELYASREATKEQLIAQHHDNNWQEKIRNNIIVLRFDSEKENSLVIKASEDLISAGYIGNRYFSDPKDKTKRFYVFEIKKDHEQNQAKAV